jgi:hypothetical protein
MKNEMGRTCIMYGKRSGAYRVLVGKPEGRNYLKDIGMDGRMVLKSIWEKWNGGGHRLDLCGSETERWQAVMNAVINLWVP